jgi:hypothetical protein
MILIRVDLLHGYYVETIVDDDDNEYEECV